MNKDPDTFLVVTTILLFAYRVDRCFPQAVVMSTAKAQAQTASLARELARLASDTSQLLTCLRSKLAQSINAAQTKVQWVAFVKKMHKTVI